MKFALAIIALVAAADSEAPVISLNLAGKMAGRRTSGKSTSNNVAMPSLHQAKHSNSFADECEVNTACVEPVASAYDHHDGDITSSIKTTYKLFVASYKHKTPTKEDRGAGSVNLGIRGEWVISYDVTDDAGNDAEKVQFALILIDTAKPTFNNSPSTSNGAPCTSQADCAGNYRSHKTNFVKVELCGNLGALEWSPILTATDVYDGGLTEKNSQMKKNYEYRIPKATYKNLVSKVDIKYDITSADFADIFGTNNQNNVRREKGTIRLIDTIKPTIILPTEGSWECGYKVPQHRYRPAALYNDCYDNYNKAKNAVSVTVTSTHGVKEDMDANMAKIMGVAWGAHTEKQTITLFYNTEDKFGNKAAQKTAKFQIVDTIEPTLYITKRTKVSGNCQGWNKESINAQGDKTLAHCDIETKEGHFQYTHGNHHSAADKVHRNDPLQSEIIIQHSAGYAKDYKYVEELMQEGTGFACYDKCSETTTTVAWKKSCAGNAAGTQFDMLKPGTYFLKYSCKDDAGLKTTACRTFVNMDKTKPVITILEAANANDGTWHIEASRDNNYVDAGATCSDMVDGNISQDVEVSGDVVNMAAVGTYKINYNCEDSAGQKANQATRTVIVEDTTCPTCTVPGASETITVEASFPYTEEASTCTDTLDGAMPNAGIYGKVNVEQTGTYVLTYSATDKNGNGRNAKKCAQAHFTKTVVVEDTMVPIISLKYKGNKLMAESTSTVNGWVIGAVASAVSGVALLGYAATRKAAVATSVPV